jgi:hypothetical protein
MLVYCRESSSNLWLNSGIVLIVPTTIMFVAHKCGFVYTFKHLERTPPALICPFFDIPTRCQERITYESRGLLVVCIAHNLFCNPVHSFGAGEAARVFGLAVLAA